MSSSDEVDKKPMIDTLVKSSNEILSELFNSFDAEPPLIIKKEITDSPEQKKCKKSKKKHKHKEKKHKKKDKKRKHQDSSSDKSKIDLAEILIKQEKESSEQKIRIEGTDLSFNLSALKKERISELKTLETVEPKVSHDKRIEIKLKSKELPKPEPGELSDSSVEEKNQKKRKYKGSHGKVKKKRKEEKSKRDEKIREEQKDVSKKDEKNKEEQREVKTKVDDLRNKIRARGKEKRSRSRERIRSRSREDFYRPRERERDHRSKDKDRVKYKHHDHKSRRSNVENPFYKEEDRFRAHYDRDRDRGHYDRSRNSSYIDKKKLLEIARKNAIHMMKSGGLPGALTLGPQAQEKVIAAIKAGGKTIEELTDFCKTLSKKEELGELSSNSSGEDSDTGHPFHHPFQIKDRPTSITMNIKNSVPLPIKSTQERSSELRLQFPVSSGQLHRKTENEWVPVPKKKSDGAAHKTAAVPPLAIEPLIETTPEIAALLAVPGPQIFPNSPTEMDVDLGSIVSQRLTALRRLQENPNDVQALTQMYKSNQEMQTWAESKQQPGQFTGTTGAQVLTQAELSSGFQAWAKKDQLTSASPVSGGMGMHLLQKMGWKPGEGLGKEKSGALEPLLLEIKLDKKGLVADDEQKKKKKQGHTSQWNSTTIQNKHPVSLLGEYASKKKLGAPQYTLCFECGPDHKKNFLFKVLLNGIEYKPSVASPNKKEAKAVAASVCLQHMGLLTQ